MTTITDTARTIAHRVPAGYYRIASGWHLQSMAEAERIALDHERATGQPCCFVRRPMIYTDGLRVHVYAQARAECQRVIDEAQAMLDEQESNYLRGLGV